MSTFLSDTPLDATDLRKLDTRLTGELAAASANFTATVTNSLAVKADAFSVGAGLTMASGVLSRNVTQGEVDNKEDSITGAATTLTGSNLASNRALVSNGNGKVVVSAVTATEIGHLDGLASNLQAQLDLLKPSACKMYRSSNQGPLAYQTGTTMTYNATEYTYEAHVTGNTGNGRFTCSQTGNYVYSGNVIVTTTGSRVIVNVKKNGSFIHNNRGGKPFDLDVDTMRACAWSVDLRLNSGDYVETCIWIGANNESIQGHGVLRWVGPN